MTPAKKKGKPLPKDKPRTTEWKVFSRRRLPGVQHIEYKSTICLAYEVGEYRWVNGEKHIQYRRDEQRVHAYELGHVTALKLIGGLLPYLFDAAYELFEKSKGLQPDPRGRDAIVKIPKPVKSRKFKTAMAKALLGKDDLDDDS
jgi:hypothetical protein